MPDIMKMGKNPNYLGSWDLDELPNREATLTIAKIVDELYHFRFLEGQLHFPFIDFTKIH